MQILLLSAPNSALIVQITEDYSSLPTNFISWNTDCGLGDRQSQARKPQLEAASTPSVSKLPQAAPNQPYLGIKITLRQRLANAAATCEPVRYFCRPAPVRALPVIWLTLRKTGMRHNHRNANMLSVKPGPTMRGISGATTNISTVETRASGTARFSNR